MKTLIYFTIAHNVNYLNILEICIKSLVDTGYDGDILFITNLENEINNLLKIKNKLLFLDPEEYSLSASSGNKLKIFKFKDIENYEKIIFSDLDVLWLKNPKEIFNSINDKTLSFSNEGTDNVYNMSEYYYSKNLITPEESNYMISNNIIGLNAGFFGFHISMLNEIKNMFYYMQENIDKISECIEQPFVNIYCFKKNIYNTNFNEYVSHRGQFLNSSNKHILHFAGGVGDFHTKFNKMKEYLNKSKIFNFNNRKEMFLSLPKNFKILEIGVFKGEFSDFIFSEMHPSELHLVDLFEGRMESADENGNHPVSIDLNNSYENLINKYLKFKNVFIKKGKSVEILPQYDDDYFDLIYIDGDHSYEGVKNDLELSLKKIKNGGYICGHDYEMNPFKAFYNYDFGVKKAVDEFCIKYNFNISLKGNDGCVSFGIKIFK